MDRLTYRHEDQHENPTNRISPAIHLAYQPRDEWLGKVAVRLAVIEDILGDDYDLDRLRELVKADRDGRCVTLCKHDFVYDELHKKIVCQKCGYVLTAEDKRRICDKGLELLRAEEAAEAALKGEQDEKH